MQPISIVNMISKGEKITFLMQEVLESTTQWAEELLQAQNDNAKPYPTMSNTHQQTPIRGQLRFSLRDGDEMQSGTLMTQEGFKQREMSQQQHQ